MVQKDRQEENSIKAIKEKKKTHNKPNQILLMEFKIRSAK
jgi:hypothetical protein